jgi:uncharacterized protein (DUF433 family)
MMRRAREIVVSVDLAYPHIEKVSGAPARLQRLPRIRVAQIVMDYLAHGWSAEEICRQHPPLKLAEVHAALGYYYDHQPEIDSEIAAEVEEVSRSASTDSSLMARLRAKKQI